MKMAFWNKRQKSDRPPVAEDAKDTGAPELPQDEELSFRVLRGHWKGLVTLLCVIWSLGQLYTAAFGTFPSTLQRAPHLGFAMVLIFLLFPAKWSKTKTLHWYDLVFAAGAAFVTLYHVVCYEDIILRAGSYSTMDVAVSILAIVIVLEAAWRVAGSVITVLAILFLCYAYFGPDMPGFLAHPGFHVDRIATFQWMGTEGVLGIPMDVSSTFIFLFMIFAAFLKKSGIGDWLTNVAVGLTGSSVGGPAKASVISSACQGTISGSSVANVVGTGSVTIPLMKSIGYRPEFAGAVEAASSTGGQLMPPIMGAAAFVMCEMLDIPYIEIAEAAAIPALLYFLGIFITVHQEARRAGLKGIPKEKLPNWKKLLYERWFLAAPLVGIIVMLAIGFTPMLSALIGVGLILAIAMVRKDTRLSVFDIVDGLEDGAKSALPVAAACAVAGIIIGVITLTGLGLKLGGNIVALAGGNVYLTLIFTMLSSLILGMGIPTTANYIIQATISAPALIQVGIPPLAAHLFVFYFGIVADITPPVAMAAFAGAGIARANPLKTGVEALKLGAGAFLVPYIFALSPALILIDATPLSAISAIVTSVLGMIGISSGLTGFFRTACPMWQRVILFAGGLALVNPGLTSDLAGIVALALIYALQRGGAHPKALAA